MANFDFTLNTFIMARERTFYLIRVEGVSAIPYDMDRICVCDEYKIAHLAPVLSTAHMNTHTHFAFGVPIVKLSWEKPS